MRTAVTNPLDDIVGPWRIAGSHVFHIAMAVDDVASATATFGAALGLTWTPIKQVQLLLNTAAGTVVTPIEAVYSREGPPYFELVSGPAGSFFAPAAGGPRLHHVGYFVDDVAPEVRRLEALGMTLHGIQPGEPAGVAFLTNSLGFAIEVHPPRSRKGLLDWFAEPG